MTITVPTDFPAEQLDAALMDSVVRGNIFNLTGIQDGKPTPI